MDRSIRPQMIGFAILGMVLLDANLIAQEKKTPERIVFFGDSITESGDKPGGYICLIRDFIKAAKLDDEVEIIGAGISGNKVPDLVARLDRDVLSHKPTIVVIYIGINDVWHSLNGAGTPKDKYREGLLEIVKRIKAAGARAVICTPSVIGERADGTNDLDKTLDEYSEISRAVARESQLQLIDLRAAIIEHLKSANTNDAANGILTTDGVHLNDAGNQFVAQVMFRELDKPKAQPKLRHVVLIKFKADLDAKLVEETLSELRSLKGKIDAVEELESGTDISTENLAQGYTHCFLLTFADEKARDRYLQHEAHQAFVKLALPHVESVLVFDYWAK